MIDNVAKPNARDAALGNQAACVCSRFTFIEASAEQADRYSKVLADRLRMDRTDEGTPRPLEQELREQIDLLRMMEGEFSVFGALDGREIAIRLEDPVDFHSLHKTSNVVCVRSLQEAVKYVNVATRTVRACPCNRMAELRDYFSSGGAQRVGRLVEAGPSAKGNPHGAMYPLHLFVHWKANDYGCEGDPD